MARRARRIVTAELEHNQLALRVLRGAELEAEDVLAALNPRDRRCGRVHASGQLGLGQAEDGAAHDDDPGKLLVGRETVVLGPELGIFEGVLDVVQGGSTDRPVVDGH